MIALIHPSRGRPDQAFATYQTWMMNAHGQVKHYLSLDQDDPQVHIYQKLFKDSDIVVKHNRNVVEATNHAAALSREDILVYLSDDFDCPEGWDTLITERTRGRDKWILVVYDGIQKRDCLTIPIMTRSLYKELGYFWNPLYYSMFVDNDLWHETRPYHIYAYDLLFKHKHMEDGRDQTYLRNNNKVHWNHGHDLFNRRSKEMGWGVTYNCRMK